MDEERTVTQLSALAQPTRLAIFRAIAANIDGLSSTQVAEETGTMPTNTSVHLSVLRQAGLVSSTKEGRTVTYRAQPSAIKDLAATLRSIVD